MISSDKAKICFAGLMLLLTISLLWDKIHLHSDTLFLERLARDLLLSNGKWGDWKLSPARAYFPDMLLYLTFYKIFPNAFTRIFFVSGMQALLLTFATLWTAKRIAPQITPKALAALILLIAATTLVASQSGMWFYFYTTNNHFAALLGPLLCVGLIVRFYEKPTAWDAFFLIILGAVAQASTIIYLISFWVPAVVFGLLLLGASLCISALKGIHRRRILCVLAFLAVSFALSWCIETFLTFHNPLEARIPLTYAGFLGSSTLFLQATLAAFSPSNLFTFFYSLFVLISVLFLVFCFFKTLRGRKDSFRSQWRLWLMAAFLVLSTVTNICGALLSGGLCDLAGYRYFSFPLALILLLTVLLADEQRFFLSKFWKAGFALFCCLIMVTSFQTFRKDPPPPTETFFVAKCLQKIEQDGFPLKAGIAEYWTAWAVSEYLPRHNLILPTLNHLYPFFWMSSIRPFRQPESDNYTYNFAIIRDVAPYVRFDYTPKTIGKHLPPPYKICKCAEASVQVWLYKDNALDAAVKKMLSEFTKTQYSK